MNNASPRQYKNSIYGCHHDEYTALPSDYNYFVQVIYTSLSMYIGCENALCGVIHKFSKL